MLKIKTQNENDLFEKGLIPEGKYVINIDW